MIPMRSQKENTGTAPVTVKKALVLISQGGYKRIGKMIEDSFAENNCELVFDYFNGECSANEINRLLKVVKDNGCDLTIGIGGGKIFDTAKAVAHYAGTQVFICPTITSTDAPCSALSVIYTDEGVFEKYLFLPSRTVSAGEWPPSAGLPPSEKGADGRTAGRFAGKSPGTSASSIARS